MRLRSSLVAAVILSLLVAAAPATAQAPPNLASARVRYHSLKNSVKPDGALKAQIEAIDQEITAAIDRGQTSQVRRLLARGMALLNGRPWSEVEDYDASLVLRSDRVFVDSAAPYIARLEQIYAPDATLSLPLTATASLRPLLAQPAGAPETRPLGQFGDVSRDLRDAPLTMELNLSGIPDGAYQLIVEVADATRVLGTASLRIAVEKGLDARLAALEARAAVATASVRDDIRYPADYIRRVNRGAIEMGAFDPAKEIAAAETIAASAAGGIDPFAKRTGGFERHYTLAAAGEIMPYRVHVPRAYDGNKALPLVIALHGLGATEDSWMDSYGQRVPALADQHGFLVAAPLGYRVDGFYGYSFGTDPASLRKQQLSEQDVMQVLSEMQRHYKVDPSRIYLMGHSMGAIGTWHLAAKYPDTWAAIGAISGLGNPQTVARMKHIPQFVVHGDADPTVPVTGSRTMVEELRKQGVDHVYVEVPGGNHLDIAVPNLGPMFDFFASRRRASTATQQQ